MNAVQNNQNDDQNVYKLSLIMKNEFLSELQCMSVVVKNNLDGNFVWFMKGSPEKILSLWSEDKIPKNYTYHMERIASQGLRIIALAYRTLNADFFDPLYPPEREDLEQDMTFLGFIIFENKLKPTTNECIRELNEGAITTVIATGDNGKTASSVALKWGIITDKDYYKLDLEEGTGMPMKLKCEYIRDMANQSTEANYTLIEEDGNEDDTDDEEFDEEAPLLTDPERSIRIHNNSGPSAEGEIENANISDQAFEDMMTSEVPISIWVNGRAFDYISKEAKGKLINEFPSEDVLDNILK